MRVVRRPQLPWISFAHRLETFQGMGIEVRSQPPPQDRQKPIAQEGPPCHPLVVAPTVMVVRAVEASPRKCTFDPAEQRLVPDMHPERDLGLAAVSAKVAFTHEHSHEEPLRKFCHSSSLSVALVVARQRR